MGRHCEPLLTDLLEENILTLDFALNHGYLGRGFRVEGWTWPRPRPVISFGRFREERCGGYSAAVTRLPAAQFPQLAPDPGTVAGDWVCPGLGYTLAMGGAGTESFTATTTIRAAQWVLTSSTGGYYILCYCGSPHNSSLWIGVRLVNTLRLEVELGEGGACSWLGGGFTTQIGALSPEQKGGTEASQHLLLLSSRN